jgi:hypothetical protein
MLEYQYRGLLHSHIGVMYLNILDTGASSSRGIVVCIWTSGCAEGKMRAFSWEKEEEPVRASLGCCNDLGPFSVCIKCVTVCQKTIQDEDSVRNGECCGFQWSPKCLKDHKCGDDPTDYC